MSAQRVLFYVQHLLGIGHLKRAATLAAACAAQGLEVTLASGGPPVSGLVPESVRFVQLPPVRAADASFKLLVDASGRAIDEAWKRARAAALLGVWRDTQPQVLVIELFPFGRRQMRFELLPLLEAAVATSAVAPRRPVVACSVRDILGGSGSAERQAEAVALVERYFDRVLVHGDRTVIAFDRTFSAAARIAGRIAYTGYIVEEGASAGGAGADEVIVSVGGGAVGGPLIEAAIGAKPLCLLRDKTWRVLTGDNLDEMDFRRFEALALAERGLVLERSRKDFTALLANCALSVSQAGYNTLMETVRACARSVVVPFSGGQETEQSLRARCFAERGLVEMVEEGGLTPSALAGAIDRAARKPKPAPGAIDLDGARRSAQLIARWAAESAA